MRNSDLWDRSPEEQDRHVWFYIYLVRCVAWVLAVIPVCIVFLTSKLTWIPICVFKSLDPEHAQRWQFYKMLYRFLTLFKSDDRVVTANKFFAQCHKDVGRLKADLERYDVSREPDGRMRSRHDRIEREKLALQSWLRLVGMLLPPQR